jgi:hypothetical protein
MLNGKELGRAIAEAIELKIASGGAASKAEIARHFEIKPPSIYGWTGRGAISKSKLLELWRYFSDVVGPDHWGLSDWPIEFSTSAARTPESAEKIGDDYYEIPQFETGGAMGDGLILKDQPGIIKAWRVNKEWLQKNVKGYNSVSSLCIVTGFGDSMRGLFNPGDPLLVDTSVKKVEFDSVYFFRVGDEGFIKRLQRIPGEGLRVLSANRDSYEPWTIRPEMDFEVLGRVLKVWRSEDF